MKDWKTSTLLFTEPSSASSARRKTRCSTESPTDGGGLVVEGPENSDHTEDPRALLGEEFRVKDLEDPTLPDPLCVGVET